MLLRQKLLFFVILVLPFFSMTSEQSFQLVRVSYPDETSIHAERDKADTRVFKKYMITTTVVLTSLVGLYVIHQMREAAYAQDRERAKNSGLLEAWLNKIQAAGLVLVNKENIPSELAINLTPATVSGSLQSDVSKGLVSKVATSVASFGLSTAKFFADSAFVLASGAMLTGFYNYAYNKINQAYVDETILWYTHEKTKIPDLFNDLKTYAIDYDLFASLLSVELFNQEASMHFKAFVKDLLGSAQNYMNNDVFHDSSYFEYLLGDMKKKYIKKGQEMEKLSDYVLPAVAKHNRVIAQHHATLLFSSDMNRREDIAKMCNVLVIEMKKLTSFAALRGGLQQQARIYDMIDSCNKFLEHMQILLNSTPEQLQELSKADCGMFTSVYEYEKLFGEQIHFLHRYCRLAN